MQRLVDEFPDDAEAHEALAGLYARGGRHAELAELHAKRFDAIHDPRERAALLRAIAEILREHFDDDAGAFEVLLDALREDPSDDESVRELEALARWNDRFGDVLVTANDWLRDDGLGSAPRVALLTHIGRWYGEELGKPAWGLPYLEQARELAPNDVRVLETLARVSIASGALAGSAPVLRRILELDPTHTVAAESLERLLLARGGIYDLIAFFEQRVREQESVALNPMRIRLAALHGQLVGGESRAHELLEDAHALDPDDLAVLRALDARCVESRRWARLITILEERLERTETVGERAELLVRLARLHEDEDLDPDRAARRLEQVLELDPSRDDAWRALERCYAKLRLWDAAVYAYERHIDAVDDTEVRISSFSSMARVLLEELDVPERALDAFRCALDLDPNRVSLLEAIARTKSRLRPENSDQRRIVAELCVATDRTDLAIDELQQAIARDPLEPALHRALYGLYARMGELDRAYSVAAALVFLHGADADQRACFSELRPRGAPEFKARLGLGAWLRDLAHPELDRAIGGVFEVIARAARAARQRERPPAPGGLGTREDAASTRSLAAKAFFGAANVLGLTAPQLFVRPDVMGSVVALPTEPPASLLGSTLLSGFSVPELMFVFGKHLVAHQGEHAVRSVCPSVSELSTLLAAALHVVRPEQGRPEQVRRASDAMSRELGPEERERLRHAAASFFDLHADGDVTRWLQRSELTGVRAGLLLCGDLSVAAKILRQEPVVAGDLSPTEKVKELVRFSVSDAHHSLRKSLGIVVAPSIASAVRPDRANDDDDDEPTRERALCA